MGPGAFLIWSIYGMVACFIATLLVALEPAAGGSGIPDLKAYLNGNILPRVLRKRTCFCRLVGLMFVNSGGLFAGTEGPMAHIGGITAAGIAMGRSSWCRCQLRLVA